MSWSIAYDEPQNFQLLAPRSLQEAIYLSDQHGRNAALLAGGCDLMDQLKTQWRNYPYLINLKSIPGLKGVVRTTSTVRIGALTTLADLERDPLLRTQLPSVALAAGRVASPQIRNVGTLGGNLLQDSRCPYYRGTWYCYRAGGIVCDAHHGINTEHAIFGADRCYTVSPSDLAPAMVALDATAIIHSAKEIRQMPIQDLFVSAREDILHMHRLGPGQILTSVEIPLTKLQRSTFVKSAMRNSWDFALASVAVSLRLIDGLCQDSRIVLGAVAATPWRCFAAERIMDGQRPSHAIVEAAANAATEGAQPLRYNEYKVALTRSLVRDALAEVFA